jgi:hypothetical protein
MSHHFFTNYYWEKGRPKGTGLAKKPEKNCFRIITDAYFKRYIVERYDQGLYQETLYDSFLLDFRKLDSKNQLGWQKVCVFSTKEKEIHRLLDLEERTILVETSYFKEGLCLLTESHHPQGTLVCKNQLLYKQFGDNINGSMLLDRGGRVVALKEYKFCQERVFTDLLYENWECKEENIPERFLPALKKARRSEI